MNSSIINQKVISLYKGNVETFQYYALQEVIQVDYYDFSGKRQKIRVSIDKDPLRLDTRKTRRATLPNFIHNLDSQLLHSVIKKKIINLLQNLKKKFRSTFFYIRGIFFC